ncbi:MAG: hypothetical protein RR585_05350, partial [Coprobacillus sp.]
INILIELDNHNVAYTFNESLHLNRFLYRVYKFIEIFDLKNIKFGNDILNNLEYYSTSYNIDKLVINTPTIEANESKTKKSGEVFLEYNIVSNQINQELIEGNIFSSGHSFDAFNRQLPVGLFKNEKRKNNSIFTYGHSAIDFWGIKNDSLYLFELKCDNNKEIGIISELLFYSNFYNDVLNKNNIFIENYSTARDFDSIIRLKDTANNNKIIHINPYFFVTKLNKLINNNNYFIFKYLYYKSDDEILLEGVSQYPLD